MQSGNLSEIERKVYNMILQRFLAIFFPVAKFQNTTRLTVIKEETFKNLVSFEGTGFQEALREQLIAKLVDLAGKAKEKVKELGKKGIKKFKDFLDKRR